MTFPSPLYHSQSPRSATSPSRRKFLYPTLPYLFFKALLPDCRSTWWYAFCAFVVIFDYSSIKDRLRGKPKRPNTIFSVKLFSVILTETKARIDLIRMGQGHVQPPL